jgi:dTDP-4-amino-4,6-dideoxygalactose transaminase
VERGLSRSEEVFPSDRNPIGLPIELTSSTEALHHIYNQFVIRAVDRNSLSAYLRDRGIGNAIYYPVPFHRQPCFEPWIDRSEQFPTADRAATEVLALPVFPELSNEKIDYVVDTIAEFYGGRSSSETIDRVKERGIDA